MRPAANRAEATTPRWLSNWRNWQTERVTLNPSGVPAAHQAYMPDYGVAPGVGTPLPWTWAEERLVRTHNYWVTSVGVAGEPHSLPVWGVWLAGGGPFVFSCGPRSRKARNIATNPLVNVSGDDTVECVSVQGVAERLAPEFVDAAIAHYVAKYASPDEQPAEELADFLRQNPFYVVRPVRGFGIIERAAEFSTKATRWVWPTLL